MSTPKRFAARYGPWAVITGASSGIGQACAVDLARRGLNTVLVGRNAERLDITASQVRALGLEARVTTLDLGEDGASAKLVSQTAGLDVGLLVAAAGYGQSGDFLTSEPDTLIDMVRVNTEAVLLQSLAYGRRFAERGRGGIILFGSIVGRQGTPFCAPYAATKGFVHHLGEGISRELKPLGVDVLVSAPGPVHTGFAARAGMRVSSADTAQQVAAHTLNALGYRQVTTPGSNARRLGRQLALLPRSVRLRVLGSVMRDMTIKDKAG